MESTGQPLEIDRSAPCERVQLDATSWVDVTRRFVAEADALLQDVIARFSWQENRLWRYEVYVTEPRLSATVPNTGLPTGVRQTGLHLRSRYRVRFDGPAVLRYRHGDDSVALHRDRSMRYLDDTLVAIVVLGQPRPFVLRPYSAGYDDASHDIDLAPGNGDLIVMGGRCQADWLHAVPKQQAATERVSFTWRWTSRQGPPDSSDGYSARRNFGDSGRVGPQLRRGR